MIKAKTSFTKNDFAQNMGVSRETLEKLSQYSELVRQRQEQVNLVGPNTLGDIWCRHMLDSAQLFNLINNNSFKIEQLQKDFLIRIIYCT